MSDTTQSLDWRKVLDEGTIVGLRELGGEDDPELLAELVELFSSDSPARIQGMRQGYEGSDLGAVEAMTHALKSASANVGALALSDLCRRCESAAKGGFADEVGELVPQIESEFEQVVVALRLAVAS